MRTLIENVPVAQILLALGLAGTMTGVTLYYWFETNFLIEYFKLFRWGRWLKVDEVERERQRLIDEHTARVNELIEKEREALSEAAAPKEPGDCGGNCGGSPRRRRVSERGPVLPGYLEYLRTRHNCFLVRLITCPQCLAVWLALAFSALFYWQLFPATVAVGLLVYRLLRR